MKLFETVIGVRDQYATHLRKEYFISNYIVIYPFFAISDFPIQFSICTSCRSRTAHILSSGNLCSCVKLSSKEPGPSPQTAEKQGKIYTTPPPVDFFPLHVAWYRIFSYSKSPLFARVSYLHCNCANWARPWIFFWSFLIAKKFYKFSQNLLTQALSLELESVVLENIPSHICRSPCRINLHTCSRRFRTFSGRRERTSMRLSEWVCLGWAKNKKWGRQCSLFPHWFHSLHSLFWNVWSTGY